MCSSSCAFPCAPSPLILTTRPSATLSLRGLSRDQTIDTISQAWVDGQSLQTYRYAPNTGSHKSWAIGNACFRTVNLAYLIRRRELGLPLVLSAKMWGFYNVLFKISYPAESHTQAAADATCIVHKRLKALGMSSDDIRSI